MSRLAYVISAYKYPRQLARLVKRLSTASSSFFVHIDKRTDAAVHTEMIDALSPFPRVWLVKRHRVDWGGFGHVMASLEGIASLLRSGVAFDHAILLTGQDYPIKPNLHIEQFFAGQGERLFLEYFPLPHRPWDGEGLDRMEAWHVRILGRHYVIDPRGRVPLRRRLPLDFAPYGGSSYWCLTRACVEYIHLFARQHPGYLRYFRYVDIPDEMFFQTIIMNSPFRHLAVNDNLRYIRWDDARSGSPAVLRRRDFGELAKSRQLFARKFDMHVDEEVLDEIDRTLLFASSRQEGYE